MGPNDQYKQVSGESYWNKPKMEQYNPSDVDIYFGKTFVSKNGKEYRITKDGKFSGRESIDGAEVMLVAGLEKQFYIAVAACLSETYTPKAKACLDELIFKHGKKPTNGLDLVMSLTDSSSKEKNRHGIIIPSMERIR